MAAFASSTPAVRADTPATLGLSAEHVRIGGTITVTVVDPGASTPAVITGESAGTTAYSLPAGSAGDMAVFQTLNPLIVDVNGDGVVTPADLTLSITDAAPVALVSSNGVFTLQLTADVAAPTPFTVTYASEKIDTLSVQVTSTSDTTGFALTLQETGAASGAFTGTFETGATTVAANATSPTASARPDVKAIHGDVVSVAYTDADPVSLVGDTILVDGVAPVVTVLSPLHNAYEQTFSSFFEVRVTDPDSGVDLSSVRIHYDGDGNSTFTEPGTVLAPDPAMTTIEPAGAVLRTPIPASSSDGLRTWYATASDLAGTAGRTDADNATSGSQAHIFTSDQNPPLVVAAIAGEWYDTVSATVKTGSRTSVHVVFSEKVAVASINAPGFRLNGAPSLSAQTYAALPNDVFLTVASYPVDGPVILMIDPGSVTDLAGLATSLVPVTVTDKVAPILAITFDRPATNSLIKINVTSDEKLAAAPSITVNGLTRDAPAQLAEREWELEFNTATLTGLDAGQGVKTVGATGFDASNTLGAATAVTFQVDGTSPVPLITPAGSSPVPDSFPDITVAYPGEAAEYAGDSHAGVGILLATLDGEPVTPLMSTADGGVTWTLKASDARPDGYARGVHVFEIQAVDAAGNQHALAATVFDVTVDPPAPAPLVPEAPPEETVEPPAPENADVPAEPPAESDPPPPGASAEAALGDPGVGEPGTESDQQTVVEADLGSITGEAGTPPGEATTSTESPESDALDPAPGAQLAEASTEQASGESDDGVAGLAPAEGAGDAEVSSADIVEPVQDPSFDREAEQRALDEAAAEMAEHASSTEEGSGTAIFGCNVPLGSSGVIGGEYALLGLGLIGLGARKPAGIARRLLWPACRDGSR